MNAFQNRSFSLGCAAGPGAPCGLGAVAIFLATLVAAPAIAATVDIEVRDGANKSLIDAVVFLESTEASRLAKPLQGVEMVQEAKQFNPAVLVVPVGTEVSFPNNDKVRHHVYSFSPAKKFELKLYAGTPANPVLFDRPGVVVMGCNIHDQMTGWILVVSTPYLGKTAASGKVQIANVPPGNYALRTWHSTLPVGAPAQSQAVVVSATGTVSVAVKLDGTVALVKPVTPHVTTY
jgi:plastocyanin